MKLLMQSPRRTHFPGLLTALSLTLSAVPSLFAIPLWDVDFTGSENEVGELPHVQSSVAGEVNIYPVAISNPTTSGNDVYVAEDYTAGSTTLLGRSAVLSHANGGGNLQMWFGGPSEDIELGKSFSIHFTTLLNDDSVGAGNMFYVRVNNNGQLGAVRFRGDGTLALYSSGGTQTDFSSAYSLDSILDVEIRFTLAGTVSGTMEAIINNNSIGSIALGLADPDQRGLETFNFERASGSVAWEAAFTNIYTIPEPTSVALLAGAAGLLLFRRRRAGVA